MSVETALLDAKRKIVAHHEAGHAVAVLMRGGTQLKYIDIVGGEDYAGQVGYYLKASSDDRGFITYAGPWAEARMQWGPASGEPFDAYLAEAFDNNLDGDYEVYEEFWDHQHPELRQFRERREQCWKGELEREWPVVQQVAQLLLTEGADMYYGPEHKTWHDTITELLDGDGAP